MMMMMMYLCDVYGWCMYVCIYIDDDDDDDEVGR